MERNRKMSPPARDSMAPAGFDLPPERAFVLHLAAEAQPPRRVAGRIEHIRSGRVAHFTSVRQLVSFLATLLRKRPEPN